MKPMKICSSVWQAEKKRAWQKTAVRAVKEGRGNPVSAVAGRERVCGAPRPREDHLIQKRTRNATHE